METAIVEGSPSEDGRPVVYLLQDVHHASIDSHRFCRNLFANGPCLRTLPFVWSMTHRIFDGHFFFQIQITRMQIHQYSIYEYLECIDLKTSTDAWFQICLLAFMLPFIFPLI